MATGNKGWAQEADSVAYDQNSWDDALADIDTSLFGGGATGSRPGPDRGDTYFNTTLGMFEKYTGTEWVSLAHFAAAAPTKGDLLAHPGGAVDFGLLAATTNDYILTLDSTQTLGMKWAGLRREVQVALVAPTTDLTTGDGKFYVHIGPSLAGMNLVDVHAEAVTAGTTGTTDIQIANVDAAVDMLSTKLTIDSGETGSDTAATAAVIDAANDDVQLNEVLRIDVDAVSTTKPKGVIVTLGFRLP